MRRILYLCIFLLTFVFGVGCAIYRDSLARTRAGAVQARERVLKTDLRVMRQAITQYQSEKGVPPLSLDDLVTAGYLQQIPPDPITEQPNWRVILVSAERPSTRVDGIANVRSAAVGKSSDGSPYAEW